MRKQYIYLLERIRDSIDWPAGCRIWADAPCSGWRIITKKPVN